MSEQAGERSQQTVAQERLRGALEQYPAVEIGTLLETLSPGATANRRKTERIDLLIRLLSDLAAARLALGTLSPFARRLLRVAHRRGRLSLAALLLAGQDQHHSEETVRDELQDLVRRGVVIVEGNGTSGTKVPLDLSHPTAFLLYLWVPQAIGEALIGTDDDLAPLTPIAQPPAEVVAGAFALLRRDLYLALRFLKQTGLRLTKVGEPHRADIRKLLSAMQGGGSAPPARRSDGAALVEGRLEFLLELLAATDMTVADEQHLWAAADVDRFLNSPEPELARRIFDAWLDLRWSEFRRLNDLAIESWTYSGAGDLPDQARLGVARRAIIECLTAAPSGWIAITDLSERLRQTAPEFLIDRVPIYPPSYYNYYQHYGHDNYYSSRQALEQIYYRGFARADLRSRERRLRKDQDWADVEGAFIAQVIAEPLSWLGLVDLGYQSVKHRADGTPPQAMRLTELGQYLLGKNLCPAAAVTAGGSLIVQPNFEVLVLDALAHLDLVAQLDSFAESQSLDRAAIYHLTRASVVRGLGAGWDLTQIIEVLTAHSREPLPQNVQQTLTDWTREYERVHLYRDAEILEAPDAATLDRWLSDPALGLLLPRRLTPTVALVRRETANEVASILARFGVATKVTNYALDQPQVLVMPSPAQIQIAPEYDDPYLRFRIERFADRQADSEDEGVAYTVSPASLQRAKAAGQSIDDILAFLGYKTQMGLAPDTVLTLRGWSGFFQPFQYAHACVVELPPTANWGDIVRVKALRPLILRILSTNLALVAEADWPKLAAALQHRGIILHEGLQIQPTMDKRSAAQQMAADLGLPTGRDLLAGAVGRQLRSGQREQLRSLQGSQLVDFISNALETEQPLVIKYQKPNERRATLRTVEPHELEVRGGLYYLHGFCRARQGERVFRLSNILGVALAAE